MPPPNPQALAAYRHILRSTRIAFKDDIRVLRAARHEVRSRFSSNRSLLPSDPAAAEQITHAEGVAEVLRRNVVQGERTEGEKYQLKIHEDTERGDNSTVKIGGTSAGGQNGCCGGNR